MNLGHLLGLLHPKLVGFPIVLLLAGLLFDLFGLTRRAPRAHWAGKVLTTVGTLSLVAAFLCGIYAEIAAGRSGVPLHRIEWHEFLANVASWGFVALLGWRMVLRPRNRRELAAYTLVGLGWFWLLRITAYLGGQLVFDYAAAVVTPGHGSFSLHDLNTLACRQTDANLAYSELMHHIFGGLTLLLALAMLVSALRPSLAPRLALVPMGLLALGGVALFLMADLDLYRLTDVRQFLDREVQLHKFLALVMIAIGLVGLRRVRTSREPSVAEPGGPAGAGAAGLPRVTAGRVVAFMALIGGALLLTHVHTVAPYANVAAGVYLYHLVLGGLALALGGVRLWQDAAARPSRLRRALFPLLLGLIALLLLTYNEGPPWFTGLGGYNRWGSSVEHPATTPIAALGPFRAELRYEAESARLELRTLDNHSFAAHPIAAGKVHVLIIRGSERTVIPLAAQDVSEAGASRFAGEAAFLRDVPAFWAQAAIPVGGRLRYADFDPWVTAEVVPVPPNLRARYRCPMHEAATSTAPGVCPLCGMPLVAIELYPPQTLHDLDLTMEVATDPPAPSAGAPVTLRLTPRVRKTGAPVRDLAVVHTKLLHLIVVSRDLSFIDHVHPTVHSDGSFTLAYTFPRPGPYLLWADLTPTGRRPQVFRLPLSVGAVDSSAATGPRPGGVPALNPSALMEPAVALAPTLGNAQDFGRWHVELTTVPRTPVAGRHIQVLFRLSHDGQPATNLAPYIGAMGHLVMISADTQAYVHAHPDQLAPPGDAERGGPVVAFSATVPRPGRYKLWPQFRVGEQILITPFVVEIQPSPAPAWLVRFVEYD